MSMAKKSIVILTGVFVAGGAVAQASSVTMYGVADAGIHKAKSNGGSNKLQMSSSSFMNNGASRLGVRGVEDLGGGASVGFNFETALDLTDGSTKTYPGGAFWGRYAKIWIKNDFGTLTLGRDLNPSFYGYYATSLTANAAYNAVGNTFRYASLKNDPTVVGDVAYSDKLITYQSPKIGGFSARVGHILKEDHSDKARWDANVMYANGPVTLSAAANKTKSDNWGYLVGGKYASSSFAFTAGYTNNHKLRRGVNLGGAVYSGPYSLAIDLTRDLENNIAMKKYTNGSVEGKYALSKRTFVYAAYLRLDGDNNYGLGVRHNF